METEEKKQNRKRFIIGAIIYAILFLAIILIANIRTVNNWLGSVLLLLRPILIGLALAYLCNPIFRFFERNVLYKLRPQGLRRGISLLLTYLTVLLIIALLFVLILPQLLESIAMFAGNYNNYVSSAVTQINGAIEWINSTMARITDSPDFLEYLDEATIRQNVAGFFGGEGFNFLEYLGNLDFKPITAVIGSAVSIVTDSLFGIFISLYLLSTKELRYAQIMKVRRALFSNSTNAQITKICTIADQSFGGFLEGKFLDSLIIGVLTYIAVTIFGIPYALLIATFVGITNIIPIIGPIIGAIPTAFILLLAAPGKVIPFLIILIIIQQIDSNIISPKILGSNTGVSSLCVLIAIATMGTLWGFVGMLLGVPLFATILEVTDQYVVSRLQKKGLPSGVENYYAGDAIVDPSKNAHPTTDKTVQKLERRTLQIRRKQLDGEELTRKERFLMRIYTLAHKYKIITEMSDEGQARFAAEEAAREAEIAANALLQAKRSAAMTDSSVAE